MWIQAVQCCNQRFNYTHQFIRNEKFLDVCLNGTRTVPVVLHPSLGHEVKRLLTVPYFQLAELGILGIYFPLKTDVQHIVHPVERREERSEVAG